MGCWPGKAPLLARLAAYLRHDYLTAASYRLHLALSLGGLALGVVPLYFIANALQPLMGPTIEGQGSQYFAFVLVGLAAHRFLDATTRGLPTAVRTGIRTGTFEALFATPTRAPVLLAGMMTYPLFWAFLQALVLLGAGVAFGASLAGSRALPALLLVGLIAVSYVPFGLLGGALLLSFRTMGPLPTIVGTGSLLLGGVYYPTAVIPSWIERVSTVIPLTYGLRALRTTLLQGQPLSAAYADIAAVVGLTIVLGAIGAILFDRALRYARRAGTLAQY